MNARDPLTLKIARTLRETCRDPYNWWEPPMLPARRQKLKPRHLHLILRAPAPIPTKPSWFQRLLRFLHIN